ncbi:MAG: MFS transporter [Burkholderiaceae bacterium]|nr:MFS transporter [Burkholderiaceae bacterium]
MDAAKQIDVQTLFDHLPLGTFQRLVLFAGFCLIGLDGFDLTCMGYVAPALKAQWHLSNMALGPVLSAALIGLAVGAFASGPIADRYGRKGVILACLLIFGSFTLAAAGAQDVVQLTVLRFCAGLGMGALLPNAATLVAEFAPRRHRSLAVSLAFCGLPASSACGGFLAAWLIPNYGWQAVLLLGGALPLLLLPLFAWKLPESPAYLATRGAPRERIRAVLARAVPSLGDAQAGFAVPEKPTGAARLVLSRRYLAGGVVLWVAYFATLFTLHLLVNWLPTLIKESGFSIADAATVGALFQAGGLVGGLALGWSMDRVGLHKVLACAYVACALVLIGLSRVTHVLPALEVQAFLLGCCLTGATVAVNALPTIFYPTEARATGTSWMHSAGRWGAILSAFAGAQMLGWGWNAAMVFMALTVPALCAGAALLLQPVAARRRRIEAVPHGAGIAEESL